MTHPFLQDLTGQEFGRLTVTELVGRPRGRTVWRCKCSCGNVADVEASSLKRNFTRSCGCYRRERTSKLNVTHQMTGRETPEFKSYRSMKLRCLDTSQISYPNYGGRGIKVCERWVSGDGERSGYQCFLLDMGLKPSAKHSIERRDSNGNYEPGNCEWADAKTQVRNRRNTIFVFWMKQKISLAEVCEKTGVPYRFAAQRIHHPKWPIEKIIGRAIMLKALKK